MEDYFLRLAIVFEDVSDIKIGADPDAVNALKIDEKHGDNKLFE